MPRRPQCFHQSGQSHFVTFSCYHRLPSLSSAEAKQAVEAALERVRRSFGLCVFGYVVMPEHVHLLIGEPRRQTLAHAIKSLKQGVARRFIGGAEHFWQKRYYDFNVRNHPQFIKKLVRRETALHPSQSREAGLMRASRKLAVEQLPPLPDRNRRGGGDRVRRDSQPARTGSGTALSPSRVAPLKPTAGLNGPPAGKERDAESGLDYFGARYYASSMGRFMSPDWSESPEAVPYANLSDPQSLNLYSYGSNNPLSHKDDDGHCDVEHHGGVWCFFHALGFNETQKQQIADARFYAGEYAKQHKGFDPSKLTDQQVLNAYHNGAFANDSSIDPFKVLGAVGAPIGGIPDAETGNWHQGSYDSAADSLQDHFDEHGADVGATSEQEYLEKRNLSKRMCSGEAELQRSLLKASRKALLGK